MCDSTVAGPTAQTDNVLASKCEYPPFRYPLLIVLENSKRRSSLQFRLENLLNLISRDCRARERHINFEHINFMKVGTTLGLTRGKSFISCVSRRTNRLFGPLITVNPGTTSRLSQRHLDVTRAKRLCLCAFFLPEIGPDPVSSDFL